MQSSIRLKLYYNHEIKGLGLGSLLMLILAIVNTYVISLTPPPSVNMLWLCSLFFIAAIVITLLLKLYQQVLFIATQSKKDKGL